MLYIHPCPKKDMLAKFDKQKVSIPGFSRMYLTPWLWNLLWAVGGDVELGGRTVGFGNCIVDCAVECWGHGVG